MDDCTIQLRHNFRVIGQMSVKISLQGGGGCGVLQAAPGSIYRVWMDWEFLLWGKCAQWGGNIEHGSAGTPAHTTQL